MDNLNTKSEDVGLQPSVLALRDELASGHMPLLRRRHADHCTVEVHRGQDSLWVLLRREGEGGFALRTAHSPGRPMRVETAEDAEGRHQFEAEGALGTFRVTLTIPDPRRPLLRCTTRLTPAEDLLLPEQPRDLYPLDIEGNPAGTGGVVHAAQRGLNTGIVYLSLARPHFGSLLYLQNLTELNPYFEATGTTPDGVVGGRWPELGYAPPASPEKPLAKGREVILSDVFLHWTPDIPEDPRQSARLYLDLMAGIYRHLDRPAPEYHDWPHKAEQTVRDIAESPEATVRQYGHLYLHPYTASEYPDSMVQLTALLPMREFQAWRGKPIPLTEELRAGMKNFFDPEVGTVRRYLPDVGKGKKNDKDPDEVDSWYLYHPLSNLGRLALEGDQEARDLFLGSLDYGIKVARHFKYIWPVQFNINTLEVITGPRKPGDPGQSDAGGLYAYVMLQAWDLTQDSRYLEEAKKAIEAVRDMEFELEYQANITAWGANACLRLWRITGEEFFRDQSYVFLASFFHNCLIWESQIASARFYPIFLGVTCLHDGPYMACYECFEAFAAFHEFLTWGGEDLPDSVRLLTSEYCKYTPSRAWYYYPKELPEEALATDIRNGHIDRKLAFPLEDLYADGQPAGQVGQEIYGCGAAFAFATRSFHRLKNAPFVLFCEYPIFDLIETDEPCLSFRTRGVADLTCQVRLIPLGRKTLPGVQARDDQGTTLRGETSSEGHLVFDLPAEREIEFRWEQGARGAR